MIPRPRWSRILFTLTALGARCCVLARDEHPAEPCTWHGLFHDCWRERRLGVGF